MLIQNGRITDDSAVRAIAVAMNKTWKQAYIILAKYSMKQCLAMNDKRAIRSLLKSLGFKEDKPYINCNVERFINIFAEPNNTYILQTSSTFTVIKNQELIENFDNGKKSVNAYWQII